MAILPRQGQRWLAGMVMLTLSGCAYIPHKPLVDGATTAQPAPASAPMPNGSIFQTVQPMNYGYQPLFEDRRPRNVGDTLTIVLQENVSASKSSSANASRKGASKFGVATSPRYLDGLLGNARADMDISGDSTFGGKGGANANNTFNGTITVTVNRAGQWQPARGRGKTDRHQPRHGIHPLLRRRQSAHHQRQQLGDFDAGGGRTYRIRRQWLY